jgi:hypothetical protein
VTLFSVYLKAHDEPVTVADRFSWFAGLFPVVYALWHRLWLMLFLWIIAVAAVAALSAHVGDEVTVALGALVALFFGLEGTSFRRAKLAKRLRYAGEAIERDRDLAAYSAMSRP